MSTTTTPCFQIQRIAAKLSRATWRIVLVSSIVLACGLVSAFAWNHEQGVHEASGLARCRTQPGRYWAHADSFNPKELYLISANGAIQDTFPIVGAKNIDWEDITNDNLGYLYLGDIGNNNGKRKDLVVYRLKEPEASTTNGSSVIRVDRPMYFRYPDQTFSKPLSSDFDAESLFWAHKRLFLLTKHSKDTKTVLYQFPDFSDSRGRNRRSKVVLKRISEFDLGGGDRIAFGGRSTSADASENGKHLALLSYHALFIFDLNHNPKNPLAKPLRRFDLNMWTTQQCEGVTWSGRDILIINENGKVFTLQDPLTTAKPSPVFDKIHDYR